jgi:hypothetical protein
MRIELSVDELQLAALGCSCAAVESWRNGHAAQATRFCELAAKIRLEIVRQTRTDEETAG